MQFTVNTNFTEISKLPSEPESSAFQRSCLSSGTRPSIELSLAEYASFGKFSQAATDAAVADLVEVSGAGVV